MGNKIQSGESRVQSGENKAGRIVGGRKRDKINALVFSLGTKKSNTWLFMFFFFLQSFSSFS